jgi:hypothetical protein
MTNQEEHSMSLGEFFWSLLVIYFMFFYFMILFRVVGDLFSDNEASGLVKTAWIIALLFVPFISLCVYLIVRGRSMTERALAHREAAEAAERDYIRRTAGTADDSATKIAKAHELLTSGAITQPEFDTLKAKALA